MKTLKVILLLLCFLASRPLHALTLSQLRAEVRRTMRDTSVNAEDQRYSDETIRLYLNEGQREVVNLTWLSEDTTEYALTPRTTYYALPADLISVEQIKFIKQGQTPIFLNETSRMDLKRNQPAWTTVNGVPTQYYVSQATFSMSNSSSSLMISYIPIPTTQSTGTVSMMYYSMMDDLGADTDIPFNGKRNLSPYHMSLVYYVAARLKMLEGVSDEAAAYTQVFNNYINTMKARLGDLPGYTPSAQGK